MLSSIYGHFGLLLFTKMNRILSYKIKYSCGKCMYPNHLYHSFSETKYIRWSFVHSIFKTYVFLSLFLGLRLELIVSTPTAEVNRAEFDELKITKLSFVRMTGLLICPFRCWQYINVLFFLLIWLEFYLFYLFRVCVCARVSVIACTTSFFLLRFHLLKLWVKCYDCRFPPLTSLLFLLCSVNSCVCVMITSL